jgi:predicted RNA-binding protein YlqC (UPF0109 family)
VPYRHDHGARRISTGETIIDEIEPEDEGAPRRGRGGMAPRNGEFIPRRRPTGAKRPPLADEIAHPRAVELLTFLAKRLVSKPDVVAVSLHPDDRGAVLELEVDPDDLGKVIGRGGRVAQALRTLVRASAEGRVTIDIVDSDEADLPEEEEEDEAEAETTAESAAESD